MPNAPALIKISTTKIVAAVLSRIPTKADKGRMVRALGSAAHAHWQRKALQELKATSRDYVDGLRWDSDEEKARIVLTGVLPNMIEQGFAGGDMRDWMFGGARAKTAKAGHKYLTIPFRHGTPGTSGRNVGIPMPPGIHEAAQKLKESVSRPKNPIGAHGGKTVLYGQRLHPDLPHVGKVTKDILHSKTVGKHRYQPWHATSIFTGIIRQRKKYQRASQSQYTSFRVISQAVIRGEKDKAGKATQHWFHPGIKARRFAQDTSRYLKKIAAQAVQGALSHE